jgi:hypothetical protein
VSEQKTQLLVLQGLWSFSHNQAAARDGHRKATVDPLTKWNRLIAPMNSCALQGAARRGLSPASHLLLDRSRHLPFHEEVDGFEQ